MLDLSVIPAFMVAVAVLLAAPGPDMMFMVATGINRGRKAAVQAALGVTAGVFVWVIITATGLAALLTAYPQLLNAIRIAGAAYLLYLGITTLRAIGKPIREEDTSHNVFRRGFIVNMTNPKMAIFFVAFLPQFLGTSADAPLGQFLMLGFLFQALGLIIDLAIGLGAGCFRAVVLSKPKARTGMDIAAAVVYIVLAVVLLLEVLLK